jgi:AcrR family transcriptional regulator
MKNAKAIEIQGSSRAKSSAHSLEVRTRRTHEERREEAERRMLDAAVKIVAARGLEELTLAECGQAAGYSRGLAAHYFGCKEDLIAAIATHIVDEYSIRLQSGGRSKRGLQGLIDSALFYIDNGRANLQTLRAFYAVLSSASKQSKLSMAIAGLNRDSVIAFAALIRDGVQRGEIRADVDAEAQAALILAALRGVMSLWLLDQEHVDLDAIKLELTNNLRRSLGKL